MESKALIKSVSTAPTTKLLSKFYLCILCVLLCMRVGGVCVHVWASAPVSFYLRRSPPFSIRNHPQF